MSASLILPRFAPHKVGPSRVAIHNRTIGAELGIPPDTVRGWSRRVTARAEWLRVQRTAIAHQFNLMLPVTVPAASPLADAVSALGTAASAVVRKLGRAAPSGQIITMIARGYLLTPLHSG